MNDPLVSIQAATINFTHWVAYSDLLELAHMAQDAQLFAYHGSDPCTIHIVRMPPSSFMQSVTSADRWCPRLSTQTTFWTQMSIDMNVDYADLTNAQAVQLVGLSVGCIFVIPFTKKYGRRSTYIFSTAVLAGACWWAAYMKTDAELFVTSLLFGLAGAPNETVVQMTVCFHGIIFISGCCHQNSSRFLPLPT